MTENIPYPYNLKHAEEWIESNNVMEFKFAVLHRKYKTIVGVVSIVINEPHKALLGYWIGVNHWGYGYATEAAYDIIKFAFNEVDLGINRIYARHFVNNIASGKVLKKIGMNYLGTNEKYIPYKNKTELIEEYALSRPEFYNNYKD